MPIGPGTRLGQYVVQDFIGEGAMGVVYRAYHPELERVGAVKVLNGLSSDPQSAARFRREAQAIAHLRHPNIVNVFDFGEHEGTPYMIVEFVEGGNLSSRLRNGMLEPDRVIRYLTDVGAAIDYAHSRGVVHRDIKPANILMTNSDTPILADFGLVKLMESSSIKSATGMATGTPAYMSPEQVTGEEVGPASDRYSFAVLAYQMLTGRIPFSEGGVLEVMYAQVHRTPQPPSSLNPALSPAVDRVLLLGLSKDPKARWASCAEMVRALESGLKTHAAAPDPAAAATIIAPPPAPRAAVAPPIPFQAPPSPPASPPPPVSPITGSFAPPPMDLPDIKYVPGRAAKVVRPGARRSSRIFIWIGIALVALIVLASAGTLVYLGLQPSVSVSPNTAAPGDEIFVTARNVPGGQQGQIQAFNTSQDFTAANNGSVSLQFVIPSETAAGNYTLSVCWDGSCPASTTVHVQAPAASSPSPQPTPSPTAELTPLTLTVSPRTGIVPGRTTITVNATGLAAGTAHIGVAEGALREFWDAPIGSNGNLSKAIVLSTSAARWTKGTAFVEVCDAQSRCTAAVGITIA